MTIFMWDSLKSRRRRWNCSFIYPVFDQISQPDKVPNRYNFSIHSKKSSYVLHPPPLSDQLDGRVQFSNEKINGSNCDSRDILRTRCYNLSRSSELLRDIGGIPWRGGVAGPSCSLVAGDAFIHRVCLSRPAMETTSSTGSGCALFLGSCSAYARAASAGGLAHCPQPRRTGRSHHATVLSPPAPPYSERPVSYIPFSS